MDHFHHQKRVAKMSKQLATLICPDLKKDVAEAGLLHDIGKNAISRAIVQKRGPLNNKEWAIMRQHPVVGAEMAHKAGVKIEIVQAIKHHHERYDGRGYPDHLIGEEIPLISRVLAVADAYDAMTSDRSYRTAFSIERAIKEIKVNAGFQFDPKVVNMFLSYWEVDVCYVSLY